jgi:hypothetical protein
MIHDAVAIRCAAAMSKPLPAQEGPIIACLRPHTANHDVTRSLNLLTGLDAYL